MALGCRQLTKEERPKVRWKKPVDVQTLLAAHQQIQSEQKRQKGALTEIVDGQRRGIADAPDPATLETDLARAIAGAKSFAEVERILEEFDAKSVGDNGQ